MNQTNLVINIIFGEYRRVFGKLLIDFRGTSPKIKDFLPQISPFLPSRGSHNDTNQSKYVLTSSNKTYLAITNHFGGSRRVFGKLLWDFWSTSPLIDDFWPQILPYLPTGATHNETNQSKYVLTSSNQTYLAITNHLGGYGESLVSY